MPAFAEVSVPTAELVGNGSNVVVGDASDVVVGAAAVSVAVVCWFAKGSENAGCVEDSAPGGGPVEGNASVEPEAEDEGTLSNGFVNAGGGVGPAVLALSEGGGVKSVLKGGGGRLVSTCLRRCAPPPKFGNVPPVFVAKGDRPESVPVFVFVVKGGKSVPVGVGNPVLVRVSVVKPVLVIVDVTNEVLSSVVSVLVTKSDEPLSAVRGRGEGGWGWG